ncbi:MAG TPA: creatininase family protein [Burkholderiaceae bacterium]|nr:creatininase family protein [Burkholderiaceae bacterium]
MQAWYGLRSADFAALDAAQTVALLPVAAVEQHGPHLPLGVDAMLLEGILAAAQPLVPSDPPVLMLPVQALGHSVEHRAFPGTLTLPPDGLLGLWRALGEGVARAGVKKLLIFNTHGGNVAAMDIAARELRAAHGLIVYSCSWFNLPLGEAMDRFGAEELRFGVHGGAVETSMMLALRPDLVRMDRARDFRSTSQDRAAAYPVLGNGRSAKLGWMAQDLNASGAAGDATQASAEKGRALIAAAARALADLLAEISALPLGTVAPGPLDAR